MKASYRGGDGSYSRRVGVSYKDELSQFSYSKGKGQSNQRSIVRMQVRYSDEVGGKEGEREGGKEAG